MYVKKLNSEIFLVFNTALVSYRDLNLHNGYTMMSIPACKESCVRQPGASGFCNQASEFCA